MALSSETQKRLLAGLAPGHWALDPETRLTYAYDATRRERLPDIVVFPGSVQEVQHVLAVADETRTPVYPRGGGTGLSGGAIPVAGGIVLTLERMNRILEIDEVNFSVTAEAGVKLDNLRDEVARHGLFFPPDPSSGKVAALGGVLAECAGGLNVVKYGPINRYVMRLLAVLPGGELIHAGSKAPKTVTGYDLRHLLIGSEGTLAVIVEATLALLAYPRYQQSFCAFFSSLEVALEGATRILRAGYRPRSLEFIDSSSFECIRAYKPLQLPEGTAAALLVEEDGHDPDDVGRAVRAIAGVVHKECLEIHLATTPEERAQIWGLRKAISPALYKFARYKINEDICVPRGQLVPAIMGAYQIGREAGLRTVIFGHCGDGNLHVNFMTNDDPDPKAEEAVRKLMQMVVSLGGTLSGEHGIGTAKAPYLGLELSPAEIALQKRLKAAFDPHNILNPGKIFTHVG
ncbi:FAD-binding oxidoreductase [bacterium]|nr:FAD-binding oxidoreductase [bacterium]